MPAVNKEAIRILVQDVGYAKTSEQTGIKQGTLRQWALRGNWFADRKHSQSVTTVTKPIAQAHADILHELRDESALHLATYARDAGRNLSKSNGKLEHARKFQQIAAGRASLFPEDNQKAGFSLNVLNLGNLEIGVSPSESMTKNDTSA